MGDEEPQASSVFRGRPQPFARADGAEEETDTSPERRMMDDPDLGEDEPDDDDGPNPDVAPAFDPKSP